MNNNPRRVRIGSFLALAAFLLAGQVVAYLASPAAWRAFVSALPRIISMLFFWGPIMAIVAYGFVALGLRALGFDSLEALRRESVEENNPAPAILFSGMLVAGVLFLMVVIKP
jgi:hypothetical protein